MPHKPRFTRIPKVEALVLAGVPTEAIATYCVLADHANNRTGECWPSMTRLAQILGKSVRTIQRHLHALKECGLVEFVERRRHRGRFSSYLYRVLHIARTTGHQRRMKKGGPIYKGTKQSTNTPYNPPIEGYSWLFGKSEDLAAEEEHNRERNKERSKHSQRRKEGYEWLFE